MYLCFPIGQIEVNAEYDRVRWPNSDLNNVCSLGFHIRKTNPAYFYYSRSWRDPSYCKSFMHKWAELKKENKEICIAARLDPPNKKKYKGKEFFQRSAPYEVIKSGNWCHSYFDGYCD